MRPHGHVTVRDGYSGSMDAVAIDAVGGSAGGVEAAVELVAGLTADTPACVLVTVHIPAEVRSRLPQILSRAGPLPAEHAVDRASIRPGLVLVAPPDRHLLLADGQVRLSSGPRMNRHRPSIDAMFASFARRAGRRSVAAILSGSLDDGAVGAALVARRGGRILVQDPCTAAFPSMPRAALAAVPGADVVASRDLGPTVSKLLTRLPDQVELHMPHEHEISMPDTDDTGFLNFDESRLTRLACPDCGGSLAEGEVGGTAYFRCHVGHQFSPQALEAAQRDGAEDKLWAAVAALEEHAVMARRLANGGSAEDGGDKRYEQAARRSANSARLLSDHLRVRDHESGPSV
jgi:two-component system chemotaxis response regulator CheB